MHFESTPGGAVVRVDGAMRCQATPCSKMLSPGQHGIVMEKERYEVATEHPTVIRGSTISLTLTPMFGWLTVETVPRGLNIAINEKSEGQSPFRPVKWPQVDTKWWWMIRATSVTAQKLSSRKPKPAK